jgi:hypothetical protein
LKKQFGFSHKGLKFGIRAIIWGRGIIFGSGGSVVAGAAVPPEAVPVAVNIVTNVDIACPVGVAWIGDGWHCGGSRFVL